MPADAGTAFDPWESILEAARLGAEWAWSEIYGRLAPKVRGYAVSQGVASPDDLVGDVFVSVARAIGSFDGDEEAFRAWLFTIAYRRIVDVRRKDGRRREFPDGAIPAGHVTSPSDPAGAVADRDLVDRLLATLTEDQRQVLTLRVMADLPVEAVARIMGKRPGAVKALQRRALAALRKNAMEAVSS